MTALVGGPGAFPPILNVTAARVQSGQIQLDWSLSLCEENTCPGAPIPCPTASPFQVIRTQALDLNITTIQGPTLGVCP